MKLKHLSPILLLTSSVWLWCAVSATAKQVTNSQTQGQSIASVLRQSRNIREIPQLSKIEPLSTSAQMLVQSPVPSEAIQVMGVQANTTENGVEVILQTTVGEQLQITNRSVENNFIADIPNAQLRLASGDAFTFSSQNPVEGISEITVINLDANTIRVTVAGEAGLPTVELFDSNEGLIFALTPATTAMQPEPEQPTSETPPDEPVTQQDDSIELVVTGQQDGYRVPNTSVGSRTDTPLRDIPQSIQVVPQQVLRDQQVRNTAEALRNVPGVSTPSSRAVNNRVYTIRGFAFITGNSLRNGLRDRGSSNLFINPSNIERIEVLKGPASVLYGQGSPGGSVNYVTKRPLSTPYFSVEASAGSFNFYRGGLDISGPLNDSGTVLYRLNLAAQTTESFVDFYDEQQYFISPILTWQISDRTRLTLETEYSARPRKDAFVGLPQQGTVLPNPNGKIPRNRWLGEPDVGEDSIFAFRAGYDLEHQFSENWQIRNAFGFLRQERAINFFGGTLADDQRTFNRTLFSGDGPYFIQAFNVETYVVGEFDTGSIRHQLVTGFDLSRQENSGAATIRRVSPIDLFNPVYGQLSIGDVTGRVNFQTLDDQLGIYIQDQMTLSENVKLLLGGRYDTFRQLNLSGGAFSPRVGIVYQPTDPISLYASYSRSFDPVSGNTFEGNAFEPRRGTQYEVGIKADLNDRLSATLALYDITFSNLTTRDDRPGVPPGFSIQVGEQRSRGVELSLAGEILPGWNVIAGYAYNDARITRDNSLPVGNRLQLAPENTFNLWTTYEVQQGSLQGLGFGLGFFFMGDKQGNAANTFQIPSYLTTDAAIFYKRDRFRAALNVKNLFNVDYFEDSLFYGEPFRVQGTISWEF